MKNIMTNYQSIGGKIKEIRENKKWSQKQLASAVGFESGTAISLIESGDRRVSIEDLEKIANVLSRDIKYFLGQEEKHDISAALRADKVLTSKDQEQILDFYHFVRNKKNEDKGR